MVKLKLKNKTILDLSKINFLDIFLPLLSIFSHYTLLSVSSVGMIIMYLYTFYRIIQVIANKEAVYFNKYLVIFIIYILISQPFVFLKYGGMDTSRLINIISIPIMFITVTLSINKVNLKRMFSWYYIVAVIASIFIIIHSVQIYVLKQPVEPIKILPMDVSAWYQGGNRPLGLFPEPQAYATFVLPVLYYKIKTKDITAIIFFLFSIILSTSSLGIIAAFFILILEIIKKEDKLVYKIPWLIIFCILFIVMIIFLLNTNVFDYTINKLMDIDVYNNSRISHGFDIFSLLSLPQQIFGIGVNNIAYFIDQGYIILRDTVSIKMSNPAYVTSMSYLLICFGIVGFVLYMNFFVHHLKNSNHTIFLILLLILSFGQTILFDARWILYLIIYFNLIKIRKNDFKAIRVGLR